MLSTWVKIAQKCGFHRQLGALAISVSRIPKPFLIKFIIASRNLVSNCVRRARRAASHPNDLPECSGTECLRIRCTPLSTSSSTGRYSWMDWPKGNKTVEDLEHRRKPGRAARRRTTEGMTR